METPVQPPAKSAMPPADSHLANALKWSVVKRALIMAAVVGTLLVTINHGKCIYVGHFDGTCLIQSALTFLVPYMVSTISSVMAMSDINRGKK